MWQGKAAHLVDRRQATLGSVAVYDTVYDMVYDMVYAVVGRGRFVHSKDVARGGASLLDSLKESAHECLPLRANQGLYYVHVKT